MAISKTMLVCRHNEHTIDFMGLYSIIDKLHQTLPLNKMKKISSLLFTFLFSICQLLQAQDSFDSDIIKTSAGDLKMTFIAHGTLMFEFNDKVIHIDPVSGYADYTKMPDADIILITHDHGDHLDLKAIEPVKTAETIIIFSESCRDKVDGIELKNGDETSSGGIKIKAVPAYNVVHKRDNGGPFHPKGYGNGYILTFGNTRVYIGGDTENFPEMKDIKDVDIAFLPMNLPYTMTPQMVAEATKVLKPAILYPYHYGSTNVDELVKLLKDVEVDVRIRDLQ